MQRGENRQLLTGKKVEKERSDASGSSVSVSPFFFTSSSCCMSLPLFLTLPLLFLPTFSTSATFISSWEVSLHSFFLLPCLSTSSPSLHLFFLPTSHLHSSPPLCLCCVTLLSLISPVFQLVCSPLLSCCSITFSTTLVPSVLFLPPSITLSLSPLPLSLHHWSLTIEMTNGRLLLISRQSGTQPSFLAGTSRYAHTHTHIHTHTHTQKIHTVTTIKALHIHASTPEIKQKCI